MNNYFAPFPIRYTERLKLRNLSFRDEQALFDCQSNKANFEFVEMPIYTSIEEAKNYVIKMKSGVDKNEWIVWAICLVDTDEIIGSISIWNLNHEVDKAELGYGLFPAYRRKGYMKEALESVLEYGFDHMKLDTIEAYTSHINQPSSDFLKSMDFEFIKTFEDDYSNGAVMDVYKKKKS